MRGALQAGRGGRILSRPLPWMIQERETKDRRRRVITFNLQGKNDAVEENKRREAQLEAEGARAHGNGSLGRSTSQASIRAVEIFETDQLEMRAAFQNILLTSDDPIEPDISPGDPIPAEFAGNLMIFFDRISLFGLKDSGQSMLKKSEDAVPANAGMEKWEERAGIILRRHGELFVVVVEQELITLQPLIGHTDI
ncbi:hypothetical protein GALMADRAFT_132754 [Galerina marginata CBS 339.88]|uniref:Uncharacterized protein n=1 Tax=Galerina marginata (strain CBS 339.88) TaxID=685588 RepID=A0A067TSK8_GALM3|nr:hypothetical protein GALMADRAFT_132754 [Galerina marginata CBS 339.88]